MGKHEFCAVILAAGKGTRMKSDLAKVLHLLGGEPLLCYPLDAARRAGATKTIAIIGHQAQSVREKFSGSGCIFVDQSPQLGTGHAVMQAKKALAGYEGLTVILCGDVPLLRPETISLLIDGHVARNAVVTVVTTIPPSADGYGRIIKNIHGEVIKIVEERDASSEEKKIGEVNTGIYCADTQFLFEALAKIKNDNNQKEYYLTDIVDIACREGWKVNSYLLLNHIEAMGINTLEELAKAELYLLSMEGKKD